mmetsp:Transcript_34752/g.61157  ORF Transcript_34752/g.61157 Transcript_34752/m.61157 type:complete len:262 (+) Transcript_34752:1052-1837(+)
MVELGQHLVLFRQVVNLRLSCFIWSQCLQGNFHSVKLVLKNFSKAPSAYQVVLAVQLRSSVAGNIHLVRMFSDRSVVFDLHALVLHDLHQYQVQVLHEQGLVLFAIHPLAFKLQVVADLEWGQENLESLIEVDRVRELHTWLEVPVKFIEMPCEAEESIFKVLEVVRRVYYFHEEALFPRVLKPLCLSFVYYLQDSMPEIEVNPEVSVIILLDLVRVGKVLHRRLFYLSLSVGTRDAEVSSQCQYVSLRRESQRQLCSFCS